jgi:hypothetical protein
MSQSRDPDAAMPHWHLDCRIESELPEDNVVGTRFLINVVFGAGALAVLLYAGWLSYLDFTIRRQIRDWEGRISDNRAEVLEVKRMQGEYSLAAAKVDEAHRLIRPQLHVYEFLLNLGKSRPDRLVIDAIEWNDTLITVHGNLRESSQTATLLVGDYVKRLGREQKMAAIFRDIRLMALDRASAQDLGSGEDRGPENEVFNFEIHFYFRPPEA